MDVGGTDGLVKRNVYQDIGIIWIFKLFNKPAGELAKENTTLIGSKYYIRLGSTP